MKNEITSRPAHNSEAAPTKPSTPAEAFALAAAEAGPLQERLAIYSAYSRELRPEVNQAYDELIARLNGLKKIGPSLGAPIPGFYLPDQDGHLVSLESLLSDGPLILSLNRGHWCPWCRLELRALAQVHDEARKLGAQAVSIIPELDYPHVSAISFRAKT
jgi:AhpC/TSA family